MTTAMNGAAAEPWYLYPITQSFNGGREKGVDLGVPYGTNVTPLFPGRVTAVDTGPYGQEVDVTGLLNGQPVTASYVHLDQATVLNGQMVGQNTRLGWSGGQLSGGNHPASPAYSSGPHIEFSLWPAGTTPYVGKPYDPMGFIQAVQSSGGGLVSTLSSNVGNLPSSATNNAALLQGYQQLLAPLFQQLTQNAANGANGANGSNGANTSNASPFGPIVSIQMPNYLNTIMNDLGVGKLSDLLWRVGLVVVGVVLLFLVANAVLSSAKGEVASVYLDSPVAQAGERAAGRMLKA